jgi:hypothetical protein
MAKPPAIPSDLLRKCIDGESPCVVAGFINIALLWIDRGDMEPPPEHKLQILSGLPSYAWSRYKKRIKEALSRFYPPFLEHWKRKRHISVKRAKYAEKARSVLMEQSYNRKKQERLSDDSAGMPLPPTYVPDTYTESGNYDSKQRAGALAVKKSRKDDVLFSD